MYAILRDPPDRRAALDAQRFDPDDESRLYPPFFCRNCGQEHHSVTIVEEAGHRRRAAGRVASMGREPCKIRESGAVEVISRRVRDRATGFAEVEARHSYEAIVDRYPNRFDFEIVQIARQRLEQWRPKT